MKRYIKSTEQAEYEREHRDNDTEAAMDAMFENEQYQDDPEVGIFWYDVNRNDLFGVNKSFASDIDWYHSKQWDSYVKTDKHLHKNVWKKESYRNKDRRFSGNYVLVPRGRVFEFKGRGLVVFIGDWIDDYPEAREVIIDEFNLPSDVEFVKDIHWDLGHGWSDEF